MSKLNMSRRQFIQTATLSGVGFVLGPYRFILNAEASLPVDMFFDAKERKILAAFVNSILPGAVEIGAISYIEGLLTAFEVQPPRIFVRGSISSNFIPLNRVQERAWRLYLYGGKGINDKICAPVVGLRELFRSNLEGVLGDFDCPGDFTTKQVKSLWIKTSRDFQEKLIELVIEGTFSDQRYGGNKNNQGWKLANFEGSQSFSHWNEHTDQYEENKNFPVSTPNPGNDPKPIGCKTRLLLTMIPFFNDGEKFY